jgi:hypothetical protein
MLPEEVQERSYHVEVSGWDVGENFFVEKTTLCWCGDGTKIVFLRTSLHEGSLVFVRLSDSSPNGRGTPVTYQIARISKEQARQGHEVELKQLHPKFSEACISARHELHIVAKQ